MYVHCAGASARNPIFNWRLRSTEESGPVVHPPDPCRVTGRPKLGRPHQPSLALSAALGAQSCQVRMHRTVARNARGAIRGGEIDKRNVY